MKVKNIFVLSVAAVTCFSLSAVVVKDSAGNTKYSKLEMDVDTEVVSSCPSRFGKSLREVADLLREARSNKDFSYSVMRKYINTGKPQTHIGPLWTSFMEALNSINYSKYMNAKCIEITETRERISAKDYLQAVVKSLN